VVGPMLLVPALAQHVRLGQSHCQAQQLPQPDTSRNEVRA
jgi:hypothetical protein